MANKKSSAAPKKVTAEKAGRTPIWDAGTTPNKTDMKGHVRAFNALEGRKTAASAARFGAEQGLSSEGIASLISEALGKVVEVAAAAALRRAALRTLNGGAKQKQTKAEADAPAKAAKAAPKGKGKKAA